MIGARVTSGSLTGGQASRRCRVFLGEAQPVASCHADHRRQRCARRSTAGQVAGKWSARKDRAHRSHSRAPPRGGCASCATVPQGDHTELPFARDIPSLDALFLPGPVPAKVIVVEVEHIPEPRPPGAEKKGRAVVGARQHRSHATITPAFFSALCRFSVSRPRARAPSWTGKASSSPRPAVCRRGRGQPGHLAARARRTSDLSSCGFRFGIGCWLWCRWS